MKLARDGPGVAPAADMVKTSNVLFPFREALKVLDIGCGPGQITNEVLKAHGTELPSTSRLIASDLAPGIFEQVEKRKKNGFSGANRTRGKVETQSVDATDLSAFPDGSVSHALSGFVLFLVPQARTSLKEIHRLLVDGGVFQTSSWEGTRYSTSPEYTLDSTHSTDHFIFSTVEGVRAELEATEFRDIEIHAVEAYMPFDTYDEVARFIPTQFPIMGKITADMTKEQLDETRDLMVAFFKEKHPTEPLCLVGTSIVGVGRK